MTASACGICNAKLHHVEIPLAKRDTVYHYRVSTGEQTSALGKFKAYPTDVLRAAVVANWQGKPDLAALVADDPHLLLTAGDNIPDIYPLCGINRPECIIPYAKLVEAYPEMFRSTPFMPVLGNHDKQIRPRGPAPPEEPVYDVSATAFCRFFALPDCGWKWRFDVPPFNVRFIALPADDLRPGSPHDDGRNQEPRRRSARPQSILGRFCLVRFFPRRATVVRCWRGHGTT